MKTLFRLVAGATGVLAGVITTASLGAEWKGILVDQPARLVVALFATYFFVVGVVLLSVNDEGGR